MSKINIIVTLRHEATHCWPACPIPEVSFLREHHRHIFHIKCKKAVVHDDRDIEIIMLKRDIEKHMADYWGTDLGSASCEQLAMHLVSTFELSYCSVLEDGENGAEVIA